MPSPQNNLLSFDDVLSKVPALTLIFRVIKIFPTTHSETAGDAVSISMNFGYLLSTLIFAGLFFIAVTAEIKAKKFHPFLIVIIACIFTFPQRAVKSKSH